MPRRLTSLSIVALTVVVGAAAARPSARAAQPASHPVPQPDVARWADSARREIEAAHIRGDAARLTAARALVERALVAHPDDALLLHYLGYALYREVSPRAGTGEEGDEVGAMLERADSALERSAALKPMPETFALRSSVTGMRIGSNPLRGMRLGPKSSEYMDRAVELGPKNPRVWMLRGVGAFHTPGMWGGGVDKAEQYLERAIALYAADAPAAPAPAWGRAEAHIWMGQVHAKRGRTDAARQAYRTALELEPEYGWVRHVLLPRLEAKANK